MNSSKEIDPEWPFNAVVRHENGDTSGYQHARDNGDGTVSVRIFEPPEGFVEQTYLKKQVNLIVPIWSKEKRWLELFKEVYPEIKN